jgi:hypothetical protein
MFLGASRWPPQIVIRYWASEHRVTKYWYRIDIVEGDKNRTLVGTSDMPPELLVRHLRSGEYLLLNDLSYRDNQNRIVSWSAWDPRLASVAYVNPQFVITVMPFVGDPRPATTPAQ